MNRISRTLVSAWIGLGTRFLPFADAATPDLPLSRLLRLSLFQVSVGIAVVLVVGTLNRVMIVELGVPASLVGIMISLPLIFAPLRVLIGFRSDNHRSELGWLRVPYIYRGTMVQFGGLAIMPFALLVLAGAGDSANAPAWLGLVGAAAAFLLVGAGMHTVQTVGLALATDLAPRSSHPNVVGLMYVALLAGIVVSALVFGAMLSPFSPGRLVQVIQAAAVVTLVLNAIAVWKQEPRRRRAAAPSAPAPDFQQSWRRFASDEGAVHRLVVVGLGTMGFSMGDILLEPYGGQVLHLSVADTTKLTAALAIGGLLGFGLASRVLSRGFDPLRLAAIGAALGVPAFGAIILADPAGSALLFAAGTLGVGFGTGLFGHGTLTATMQSAPKDQAGLALGVWGAVQATAAGVAIALGGIGRDLFASILAGTPNAEARAYQIVYAIELVLLIACCAAMYSLVAASVRRSETISSPP